MLLSRGLIVEISALNSSGGGVILFVTYCCYQLLPALCFILSMASYSQKANLLVKRKPEDGLGTEPVLKKHKEKSEEKEIEARVELLSDIEANLV